MKRMYLFLTAMAFTAACSSLFAQTAQSAGIVYQQAGVMGIQSGGGAVVTNGAMIMSFPDMGGPGLFTPETVAGSPLSATHQSHSLQVLSDGTRIERSESQQIYRDSMGRTRIESGPPGSGTVMIQDPVSGVMAVLDPATRTAQKMPEARLKASALPGNAATTTGRTQAQFSVAT